MQFNKYTHTTSKMTRMAGPDYAVMFSLVKTHTHTHIHHGDGDGNGDGDKDRVREGVREAKKRKKPQRSCRRDVGNEGDLGTREKT